MQRSRFQRISEIFSRAADLAAGERAAFLDAACGDDLELRRDVESLLEHDRERRTLRTGVFGALPEAPESAPTRIGPYRVLETLGEGGMGVVYRARQETPFRRDVAVKLLRRGLETELFISRFESERQALAAMNHPNVASVYDAGISDDGRPYFAMELVQGETITAFCRERQLDVEGRLALFRRICEGVQHAHQKGIIHRDLKPSNVLVTVESGVATPKIIDFGVAKTLDKAMVGGESTTEAWMLLGTPEYMSPEHALRGPADVDTRSDVYALGVILYELLTDALPIERAKLRQSSFFEVCRAIREDVPTRPSLRVESARAETGSVSGPEPWRRQRARDLRGELDWVTMKALEKDPALRYATPMDLARDLERALAFEPVTARPPSLAYKLKRFARKHRTAVAASALLLVAVSILASFATAQSVRASREAARAERQAAVAAETAEFLIRIFGESKPYYKRGARQSLGQMLDVAVRTIREDLVDQPVMQARLLHATGDALQRERKREKARPLLEEAREILVRSLGEADPTTERVTTTLARVHLFSGQPREAERMLTEILERRRAEHGNDHPQTLIATLNLGVALRTMNRNEAAVPLLEDAIEGLGRFDGEHAMAIRSAQNHLASAYLDLGRFEDARVILAELIEVLPALLGDRDSETMIARYNLGCVLANLGETEAALRHLEAALRQGFSYPGSMYQDPNLEVLRSDPAFEALDRRSRINGRSWVVATASAMTKIATGREKEAERLLLELLDSLGLDSVKARTENAPMPVKVLVELYLRQGRYDEAERLTLKWIDVIGRTRSLGDRELAAALMWLSQCHLARGDEAGALELIDRSLAMRRRPYRQAYARAVRFALGGAEPDALDALRAASELGFDRPEWARHDVAFVSLRESPQFASIVDRMERNQL